MADGAGLFAHLQMRQSIVVRFGPVTFRIFAARPRFGVEVMRLPAAFFDEILSEPQVAFLARRPKKLDQRQFNFWMTAIAGFLPRSAAKNRIDMISVAAHQIQEATLACGLEMRYRRFHEMPRTIEFEER